MGVLKFAFVLFSHGGILVSQNASGAFDHQYCCTTPAITGGASKWLCSQPPHLVQKAFELDVETEQWGWYISLQTPLLSYSE